MKSPDPILRISSKKYRIRGAGDLLAVIAQPIARAIDAVLKTDIKNCSGCKARKDRLNQIVPFQH